MGMPLVYLDRLNDLARRVKILEEILLEKKPHDIETCGGSDVCPYCCGLLDEKDES